MRGIRRCGLPSRIRLDKGSEYNKCHQFMEWQRGPNRGSSMRGKSTHNQRIERLWRDVFTKVLEKFYKLFYHMEDTNVLDISNPIHRFALHFIFLPRIQAALSHWLIVHNNHGVRTAGHQTPEQMWFTNIVKQRCALQAQNRQSRPSQAVGDVASFNLDNLEAEVRNRFDIQVSDTRNEVTGVSLMVLPAVSDHDLQELRRIIDPMRDSQVEGIDVYGDVVDFLLAHMDGHDGASESDGIWTWSFQPLGVMGILIYLLVKYRLKKSWHFRLMRKAA